MFSFLLLFFNQFPATRRPSRCTQYIAPAGSRFPAGPAYSNRTEMRQALVTKAYATRDASHSWLPGFWSEAIVVILHSIDPSGGLNYPGWYNFRRGNGLYSVCTRTVRSGKMKLLERVFRAAFWAAEAFDEVAYIVGTVPNLLCMYVNHNSLTKVPGEGADA